VRARRRRDNTGGGMGAEQVQNRLVFRVMLRRAVNLLERKTIYGQLRLVPYA
jgi:hypothetical protein